MYIYEMILLYDHGEAQTNPCEGERNLTPNFTLSLWVLDLSHPSGLLGQLVRILENSIVFERKKSSFINLVWACYD